MNDLKKNEKNRNLYDFDVEENKKKKSRKRKQKSIEQEISSQVDSDNEIIIGVTRIPDKNENNNENIKKTKKRKNVKKKNKVESKQKNKKQEKRDKLQKNKEQKKKRNYTKILKWTSFFIIIIGVIVFAMVSPIFNIKEIEVLGTETLTEQKIISLSNINMDENLFKINKKEIKNNIKTNGYVEDVKIKRSIPNKVKIIIEERTPSFVVEYGSGYVYLNNQGYILEINSNKIEVPILLGLKTKEEEMVEASRLCEEDLKKLGTVLKIMDVAEVNDIAELITKIDITDEKDYKLYFDSEQKTAYLGDCSDLETRMLYLTAILRSETGKEGEIFVNMNLNQDNVFFRENV